MRGGVRLKNIVFFFFRYDFEPQIFKIQENGFIRLPSVLTNRWLLR